MKFSESWLREWVNPAIKTEQLAEQITMAGLEVEEINTVSGLFNSVVIGLIVECQPHPNADKLQITKVDVGGQQLLNIVCGASNCRVGLKVACATVGAILPGDFKIKTTKLRGEISEGMLCSYSELGIDIAEEGIIELPEEAPVGVDVRDYLVLDDHQIELNVTPNRSDCLSLLGIARDIAVINKLELIEPKISAVTPTNKAIIPIKVTVPDACPRYLGRIIKNCDLTAVTPIWMKEKLRRCGLRSIDPVVDITNFVLLEWGQPMHAFDLSTLQGGIIVRMAEEEEKLTLLDGNEVRLSSNTLVIADEQKVLAIAGIFGGLYSSVTEKTKDILLECAYFDPLAIMGRARQYGLHTESSHRYERGVDPTLQYRVMERATELLVSICGGEVAPIIDTTHVDKLPRKVSIILRCKKLYSLLGHVIAVEQIEQILTGLGCVLESIDEGWNVVPPSWRFDLSIEEDLIEEVARIYGYDHIPLTPLHTELKITADSEKILSLSRVKTLLVDRGYYESITYSFVDPKKQILLHPNQDVLLLPNPISQDMSAMRVSLWTGLLAAVIYNQHRQQSRVRLFESGLRFIPDLSAELGVRQELVLSGIITGKCNEEHWSMEQRTADFYDLKGDVEAILDFTGKADNIVFRAAEHSALHPGQSSAIYLDNEVIGYIGAIHPKLEDVFGLNGSAMVFELLWDKLSTRNVSEIKEVSRYPANRRDIAIVIADEIPADDVIRVCKKIGENQVVDVNLFDVYRGKGIAKGYKSLAISILLQDNTRTLEEDEIATTIERCVVALKEQFQASLRD